MEHAYVEEGTWNEGDEYDPALEETETSSLYKGPFSHITDYFKDELNEKSISRRLSSALVNIIAQRYAERGVELPDLIRQGSLGLDHALENFELEGGQRFSTYAARCIRRNIEHAITCQQSM